MALNIQELHFSVNSAKKVYREKLFKGTQSVCTWKISVDLQRMQIQKERSRIYKQAYS